MPSIPSSQQDSANPSALAAVLGVKAPRPTNVTQLFDVEVERAIERQGGEAALDARRAETTNTRRAGRRAGFDGYREKVSGARDDGREEDGSGGEQVLVDNGGRSDSAVHRVKVESESGTGSGTGSGERVQRSVADRRGESADAKDAAAGGVGPSSGAAPGPIGTNTSAVLEPAKLEVAGVRSSSAPRPVDGTAVFLSGARAERGGDRAAAAALPERAMSDAELIEHAAEVLKQIRLGLKGGGKEITVQLSPAELGRLSIRMRLEGGKLATVIRVESPQTLELLERQAPELRALIAQQGVESDSLELQLGFGGAHEQALAREGSGHEGRAPRSSDDTALAPIRPTVTSTESATRTLSEHVVDIQA